MIITEEEVKKEFHEIRAVDTNSLQLEDGKETLIASSVILQSDPTAPLQEIILNLH